MKYLIRFGALVLFVGLRSTAVGAETAESPVAGGRERVCTMGMAAQNEQGFAAALARCKPGDILDIGWAKSSAAMQVCDFGKAIVYHPATGAVVACVYIGYRRSVMIKSEGAP